MPTLPINLYKNWDFHFESEAVKPITTNIDEFFTYQQQHPDQRLELINGLMISLPPRNAT